MHSRRVTLFLLFELLFCLGRCSSAQDFFVDPAGNDASDGSRARPFATLAHARDSIRQSKQLGEPATVILHAGTYYLPETLVLTDADSGTKEAPVVWRAADGENVIISGGTKLDLKWEVYKGGILKAEVPKDFATDQLFVNGERQNLARYPNFDPNVNIYNGHSADSTSRLRVQGWSDPAGGFMHAMHSGQWGGFSYLITGKDEQGNLKLSGGWQGNRASPPHPSLRFVENIFEELDAPGEWFLNPKTSTLYFYPPGGVDPSKALIEVPRLKHLIELRGSEQAPVKWVAFRGITFRHTLRTFMETKEPLLRSDWTVYRGGAVFINGSEDCAIEDCFLDQPGGNSIFINNYNRRVSVRGCRIEKAGGSGVMILGDPKAVRSPLFEYGQRQPLEKIDRKPGPLTNNYPSDCRIEDCLIALTGRVEKQAAGLGIDMAARITVSHCSIYDVPRAGINIGDGCWGGHVIEFCDIFDTIQETGDHGSFNSWGRDRYWLPDIGQVNKLVKANPDLPLLDVVEPNILRNSRWRCDHGWDIDLDDGSSNYQIYNNLCLAGGIKHREGYKRVCRNNIMVNNSFHPHVWFENSGDVFSQNIVMTSYRPIGMPAVWGAEVDHNLLHIPGKTDSAAAELQKQSGQDKNSLEADALFIDPENGDFRVAENSPALKLGFKNFPMDQFGVQKPALRALAKTPAFTRIAKNPQKKPPQDFHAWMGAKFKTVSSLGEQSAAGLNEQSGALLIDVPDASLAAKAGLRKLDVILACNGKETKRAADLLAAVSAAAGEKLQLRIWRNQKVETLEVTDYIYVLSETRSGTDFKTIPLALKNPAVTVTASEGTNNDPLGSLLDGALAKSYGPIFGNGIAAGKYKLSLNAAGPVTQVNSWSFNMGGNRGAQKFLLYASDSAADPGWDISDAKKFTLVAEVDTRAEKVQDFSATSVRRSAGAPLGSFRWLVWALAPISDNAGGENTSFQEFQVTTGDTK